MLAKFSRSLKLAGFAVSFAMIGIAAIADQGQAAEPRVVVGLDATEPFEALAFHGGVLWVGNSRQAMGAAYNLKLFSSDGSLLVEQAFPHSQTYIYPYNDRSVLIVGLRAEPNLTHYSIVTYNGPGRALLVKTTVIPAEAWAYQWLGTLGTKEYFIDMSGLVDDPERDANPNLASRTLFSLGSGRASYATSRVRMPIQGIKVGPDFFVLSRAGMGQPHSAIAHVKSGNFSVQNVFSEWRNLITDIQYVPAVNLIAMSESGAEQVLLVEPTTHEIKGTFPLFGNPRSIAVVGHCIVVGSEQTKKVALIDVRGTPELVDSADFSAIGTAFKGIRKLAVDKASSQVFARSSYACNPMVTDCSVSENSVAAVKLNMTRCLE